MYCSSCGAAVAKGLTYCNHCGERLSGAKDDAVPKPAELFPESLVWAIVTVFIVGVGCTIGLMAMMKEFGFDKALIVAFPSLVFLLMLAVEGVFIRLLLGRKRSGKEVSDTERVKGQTTKVIDAAQARALPEPAPSVTEHTTRTFEPVYDERKVE